MCCPCNKISLRLPVTVPEEREVEFICRRAYCPAGRKGIWTCAKSAGFSVKKPIRSTRPGCMGEQQTPGLRPASTAYRVVPQGKARGTIPPGAEAQMLFSLYGLLLFQLPTCKIRVVVPAPASVAYPSSKLYSICDQGRLIRFGPLFDTFPYLQNFFGNSRGYTPWTPCQGHSFTLPSGRKNGQDKRLVIKPSALLFAPECVKPQKDTRIDISIRSPAKAEARCCAAIRRNDAVPVGTTQAEP